MCGMLQVVESGADIMVESCVVWASYGVVEKKKWVPTWVSEWCMTEKDIEVQSGISAMHPSQAKFQSSMLRCFSQACHVHFVLSSTALLCT